MEYIHLTIKSMGLHGLLQGWLYLLYVAVPRVTETTLILFIILHISQMKVIHNILLKKNTTMCLLVTILFCGLTNQSINQSIYLFRKSIFGDTISGYRTSQ
jgi:hypothetical protein